MVENKLSTFALAEAVLKYLPHRNGYFPERGPNERYSWILNKENTPFITVSTDELLVHSKVRPKRFERSLKNGLQTVGYEIINIENPAHLGSGFLYITRPIQ